MGANLRAVDGEPDSIRGALHPFDIRLAQRLGCIPIEKSERAHCCRAGVHRDHEQAYEVARDRHRMILDVLSPRRRCHGQELLEGHAWNEKRCTTFDHSLRKPRCGSFARAVHRGYVVVDVLRDFRVPAVGGDDSRHVRVALHQDRDARRRNVLRDGRRRHGQDRVGVDVALRDELGEQLGQLVGERVQHPGSAGRFRCA